MDENTREIFVQLLLRNIRQMYYSRAYCYPRLERFMVHAPPPPPPSEELPPSKESVDDPPKPGAVRIRFLLFVMRVEATSENTIILFVCPSKFCISIVFVFSRDLQWSQEKNKNNAFAKFRGTNKSIMVFSELSYCECYQEWM